MTCMHRSCYKNLCTVKPHLEKFRCDNCRVTPNKRHCRLCHNHMGLPMQGKGNFWQHPACLALNALLQPEEKIKCTNETITIDLDSQEESHSLKCSICQLSGGLIYSCSKAKDDSQQVSPSTAGSQSKCFKAFHPICAYLVISIHPDWSSHDDSAL